MGWLIPLAVGTATGVLSGFGVGGGTLGGWLGGRWFQKTRVDWLRRLFGALLIWGGVRCLL